MEMPDRSAEAVNDGTLTAVKTLCGMWEVFVLTGLMLAEIGLTHERNSKFVLFK
jgi:hypothetical protein